MSKYATGSVVQISLIILFLSVAVMVVGWGITVAKAFLEKERNLAIAGKKKIEKEEQLLQYCDKQLKKIQNLRVVEIVVYMTSLGLMILGSILFFSVI